MRSTILLLLSLVLSIVVAQASRYEQAYWQEDNLERYENPEELLQEQGYYEDDDVRMQQLGECSIELSQADQRLAASLDGARSLPPMRTVNSLSRVPMTCEAGPRQIIHSIEDEFHVPHILKGTCNGLTCSTDRCRIKRAQFKTRCVLVFRFINGLWTRIGFRNIRYSDHLDCECKQCKHITTREECHETTICPNGFTKENFCYWTPSLTINEGPKALEQQLDTVPLHTGRCGCCSPQVCKHPLYFNRATCSCECRPIRCPLPQVFNQKACRCECPRGTTMTRDGKCIGNCRSLGSNICFGIYCEDNPSLKCMRLSPFSRDCVCPSCSDATTKTCSQTRCLGQPSKPMCVINKETNSCDCPTCHHQTNPLECGATQCGNAPSLNCKFSVAYKRCYCPYTGCNTLLPGK